MFLGVVQGNDQGPASCGYLPRIVPFQIVRFPVMQIDGFPVWVVTCSVSERNLIRCKAIHTRVEGPSRPVELIREDQFPTLARLQARVCVCTLWGVLVNQRKRSNVWYLTGRVDSSQIVCAVRVIRVVYQIGREDGIPSEHREHHEEEEDEASDVAYPPKSEDGHLYTRQLGADMIGIMKVVICFWSEIRPRCRVSRQVELPQIISSH